MAQVTLEGDVVRKSTGEPLPGVRVALWNDPHNQTVTGVTGHFQFTGLPARSYQLLFDGLGMLPRYQSVAIDPQDTHLSLQIAMTPQAAIAGKVVDESGWPLAATVTAAQYQARNGPPQLQPVRSVQTDDRGAYRIGKLPPGRYYLRVRPRDADYLPVWYPAAAAEADARAIDLPEGQEAARVDIHLTPGGGVPVSGRVIVPEGYQVRGQAYLKLVWEDLRMSTTGESVPLAPDGTFLLRHLAPGNYWLTAAVSVVSDTSAPPRYSATRFLQVAGDKIDGVTLTVAPTVVRDLKGTIAGDLTFRPDQVHIELGRSPTIANLRAKVQPDGSFVIPGVWLGRYIGNAWVEGGGRVESFRFGGREILGRDLDFDGAEAPLHVALVPAGAMGRIAGTRVGRRPPPRVRRRRDLRAHPRDICTGAIRLSAAGGHRPEWRLHSLASPSRHLPCIRGRGPGGNRSGHGRPRVSQIAGKGLSAADGGGGRQSTAEVSAAFQVARRPNAGPDIPLPPRRRCYNFD